MERVLEFLKENPVFYFATVEGDKPRVRPFGFCMEYEGKLYFGMGTHKKVYQQILVNPHVEISTTNAKNEWIRISGKVVIDDREELPKIALEKMPILKNIYNEQTGFDMILVYLKDAKAEFADMSGKCEKVVF